MSFYQAARSWARHFAVAIDWSHRSTRPGELGGDPALGWRGEMSKEGQMATAKCNINETYERRKRRKATKVEYLGCYSEEPKLTILVAGSITSGIFEIFSKGARRCADGDKDYKTVPCTRSRATAKARSLIVVRRVVGTARADEDVVRRRRREVTATDWMASPSTSMAPYRKDSCIQERARPPGTESVSPAVFETSGSMH